MTTGTGVRKAPSCTPFLLTNLKSDKLQKEDDGQKEEDTVILLKITLQKDVNPLWVRHRDGLQGAHPHAY